jgi:hypothetical protein
LGVGEIKVSGEELGREEELVSGTKFRGSRQELEKVRERS